MLKLKPSELLIFFLAAIGLYIGWQLFWFLTDDAYIAFRYCSNLILGRGLTWNPPPFAPVEGYSSFLWVSILSGIWALTGIEPPESANWVALFFGYAYFALIAILLLRALPDDNRSLNRNFLLILALIYIIVNRTFLAWLSSGLETALFNFLVIWWVFEVVDIRIGSPFLVGTDVNSNLSTSYMNSSFRILRFCLATALLTLTRPDGMLFYLASVVYLLVIFYASYRDDRLSKSLFIASFSILSITLIHLISRKLYYGYWVPNTYYAKVVQSWPEMGLKYITAFIIEYGLYIWITIVAVFLKRMVSTHFKEIHIQSIFRYAHYILPITVISGYIIYYVLIVGGDHFEYRIFSFLIPLASITMTYIVRFLYGYSFKSVVLMALLVLCSLPLPWTHWWRTHDLMSADEAWRIVPVSPVLPSMLHVVSKPWDYLQADMNRQSVGRRHQVHKVFHLLMVATNFSREEGEKFQWEKDHRIMAAGTVGVIAWTLPNVAIIDVLGLNDIFVAHMPQTKPIINSSRHMAHDRMAPREYIKCFSPSISQGSHKNGRRKVRLSADIQPGSQLNIIVKKDYEVLNNEAIENCEQLRHD